MLRTAAVLVLALALSGCDVINLMRDGMQHVREVETDLEQSTGVKPEVGFNWHNGRFAAVTVEFPRLNEDKPLAELAALVRSTVIKDFKQTPDKVVLSFALTK